MADAAAQALHLVFDWGGKGVYGVIDTGSQNAPADCSFNLRLAAAATRTLLPVLARIHAKGYVYTDMKAMQLVADRPPRACALPVVKLVDFGAGESAG